MDLQVLYPRATPEEALLDWIYLGDSPRTKLALPPLIWTSRVSISAASNDSPIV